MFTWLNDNGPLLFLALLDGTVTAFVLALIALGLSLVFGVMRIVNVAHGEFFMLGAVLSWFAFDLTNDPLWGFLVALVLAPMMVGSIAIFSDRFILRKISYHPESTIVATIGLLYVIQQLTLMFFGRKYVLWKHHFILEFNFHGSVIPDINCWLPECLHCVCREFGC